MRVLGDQKWDVLHAWAYDPAEGCGGSQEEEVLSGGKVRESN